MIVAFYSTREVSKKLIGRVWIDESGKVVASGSEWIKEIASEPIGPSDDDLVGPEDGEAFLEALLLAYRGSALSAIKE